LTYFVLAAIAVSGVAAWTDWRTGLIPNWLTFGAIGVGVIGHFATGLWLGGARAAFVEGSLSIAGLLFCAVAPGFMYAKGAMGGGDLKLFAALGALCQPLLGIEAEMYGLVAAAIIAPARLAFRGELLRVLGNTLALVSNPLRPAAQRRELPPEMMSWFRLGPAIFAGTVVLALIHGYEFWAR
jgi:prepilin peptidase CpaA